jgi:polygalacturonase
VTISDVKASNVTLGGVTASCFQAIVAQGPVAFDYNGAPPTPAVQPISGVTIRNCDFGTPVASGTPTVTSPGPVYAFNVSGMTLTNVAIAGQTIDTTITDRR